ncbi:MAG: ATP-binding protein, partial [[Clostridium] fimetarium]|nr:ATP-binding protein [[Clostridium] fimetarium]
MKKAILIALLLATLTVTAAVHTELKFKQIGLSQGLSHATVAAIGQDADGYMWIATPDGLNRFDGYGFRVYRPEDGNENSLATNSVKRVAFDAGGAMWVSGDKTLSRYDSSADNFRNFRFDHEGTVTDIMPIDSARILVGSTSGLYTFNPASGEFSKGVAGKNIGLAITSLSRQGDNIYLSAGKQGLSRLNLADGSLTAIRLGGEPVVSQTLPDGKTILVATEGLGLIRLDSATGKTTSYRAGGPEGLGSDYVRSLAHDNQGRVWIGTFTGLDILDTERKRFEHYGAAGQDSENLSHASVRRIYADHQGGMWLGTFFGGLNYHHPLKNQFHTLRHSPTRPSLNDNVVGAMTEDADRNLWIATNNGGLNLYNPANDSYRHFTKADGLGSNDVKAIYIDEKAGKVYIGSHLGGLNILDKRTGRMSKPSEVPSNIYGIVPARREGHLWLATIDRLVLYNIANGTATAVTANGLRRVTDLYRDSRGLLWVSGEDGMTAFAEDADSRLVPAPEIPAELNGYRRGVNNVYLSRDGRNYYISTNDGLIRFNADSDSVSRLTTAQGMPNNIVYGVLEDANGNLWCSTNRGLAFLNPATGAIRAYSDRDGLQSNQFNRKSFLRSSAGYLYFGGINGLTYFNPTVLESNPYAPAPIITGLRLFNKPVVPGDDTGLLERSVAETAKVTFGADQTVFTIDFTVCNYVAGNHNTFSYKLEGLEDQWTTIDGPGSVTYSNLPPGDYRFLLKAANNDGVWCEETTGLDITIMPKWYNRWWARILFVLLIAGAIALVMAYFYRRKARRERERLATLDSERQRELNEMKVRFFINMSHELRTPLTLILLPVQELLQRATDRKTAQKLSIVKNNAERILRIVNQLLDYRRAEMGMFKLKAEPVVANDLLRKIFANYEYQATRRGIDYTFDSTMPDTPALCDPQYIDLICNNLISNAFKYTPKGQSINVALAKGGTPDKPTMRVTVKDTGCGIPAEKLPEIFTRFYKVYDRAGGSGIGLSLVKRLVELHHGTITVDSELGAGTTFTVELPIGPSEYSPEEIASETAAAPATALPAPLDIPDMTELPEET